LEIFESLLDKVFYKKTRIIPSSICRNSKPFSLNE
jgi:hypothetical protein